MGVFKLADNRLSGLNRFSALGKSICARREVEMALRLRRRKRRSADIRRLKAVMATGVQNM